MSRQLPVGWEERRNNLSERDMMLVRVATFTFPSKGSRGAPRFFADEKRTRGRRRRLPDRPDASPLPPTLQTRRVFDFSRFCFCLL